MSPAFGCVNASVSCFFFLSSLDFIALFEVKIVENILPYCGELLAGGVDDFNLAKGSEFLS